MKNKRLFNIITWILLLVSGVLVFFLATNISVLEHFIQRNTVKRIHVSPALFTGAINEKVNVDEKTQQTSKLINILPVRTQAFSMDMDYANNRILVTVNTPSATNYPLFRQWLSENGYTQIPSEKFDIKNQ